MHRLQKFVILAFAAAIPAAAAPFLPASQAIPPNFNTTAFPKTTAALCFTAGAVTYELSQAAAVPDFRVRFDDGVIEPDLRVGLADGAATADFTLVDDVIGIDGNACQAAGPVKTVRIVGEGAADVIIRLTRDLAQADFKVFVHSGRFNHRDAAALFAVMRHNQKSEPLDDAVPEED
jgi:hypothetical protein